jgi:hypothetical protein
LLIEVGIGSEHVTADRRVLQSGDAIGIEDL